MPTQQDIVSCSVLLAFFGLALVRAKTTKRKLFKTVQSTDLTFHRETFHLPVEHLDLGDTEAGSKLLIDDEGLTPISLTWQKNRTSLFNKIFFCFLRFKMKLYNSLLRCIRLTANRRI